VGLPTIEVRRVLGRGLRASPWPECGRREPACSGRRGPPGERPRGESEDRRPRPGWGTEARRGPQPGRHASRSTGRDPYTSQPQAGRERRRHGGRWPRRAAAPPARSATAPLLLGPGTNARAGCNGGQCATVNVGTQAARPALGDWGASGLARSFPPTDARPRGARSQPDTRLFTCAHTRHLHAMQGDSSSF
jgi:hypothetical protein